MDTLNAALLVAGGLVALVVGGEILVRGAVSSARRLGVSPLVIGLTLVGFGTSAPELVTSLQAALSGSPGIAMGNVVGSNIGNVLLILGVAAMIAPVAVAPQVLRRDGTVVVLATALCVGIVLMGEVGRLAGLVLLGSLAAYLWVTIHTDRKSQAAEVYEAEAELMEAPGQSLWVSLAQALGGLVGVVIGARLLVSGAVSIAEAAGVSETVIGLTLVAIGTSMPELVTSVIAMRRGQGDVALGNILGSNIFNILGILGVTALVAPLEVPPEIIRGDIWVMAASTVLLMLFARTGWEVRRGEGVAMVAGYGAYMAWLLI